MASSWLRRGLPAALTLLILAALPAGAQTSADRLADEIAQAAPAAKPAAQTTQAPASSPLKVSALDVVTKLSALVIVVYALTWGLRWAQRQGLWQGSLAGLSAAQPASGLRLRRAADIALRAGACLHLIEADGHPLLVAVSAGGQVTFMDLAPATKTVLTPLPEPPAAAEDPFNPRALAALKQDDDWEHRRETLIRALAQRG